MLKFAHVSDLHLGFFPDSELPAMDWHPDARVVLLAGDILDGLRASHIDWVLEGCEGRLGLMILGNHELYKGRRDKAIRVLNNAFRGSHVSLLVNESVVIQGYASRYGSLD